jgi:hypothetical protein
MAMASRPATGEEGPSRGSMLSLGDDCRGSARGTRRQVRGRGRAQSGVASQGGGPPLGSGRARDAAIPGGAS